ncbi:regulatory protein, tetR family [Nonomuraea solani]|uniref:Regulatory protein, tetR family n=1 Tax=Nonomuraea solani TaxID=1144553 RepID=A0A1H6EWS6_9ACTN|nr:TetR family transcriptional regulator [Nonomuraea solani]SEH01446.1 regulatory protein, tetR family [Nonomuraea solani]
MNRQQDPHQTPQPDHPLSRPAQHPAGTPTHPHNTPTQARGRRRRATLLSAAVDLLTDGGFAAVTHRAVAQRAHLPLAATTYYFASRDQLLAEAFAQLVETELATTRTWLTHHGLPTLIDQVATTDRTRQLGLWELYVHAGRDPVLQTIARRWTDGCVRLLAETLDLPPEDPRVRLLYTTVSTLWLEHLVEQRPLDEARHLLNLAIQTTQKNTLPPP